MMFSSLTPASLQILHTVDHVQPVGDPQDRPRASGRRGPGDDCQGCPTETLASRLDPHCHMYSVCRRFLIATVQKEVNDSCDHVLHDFDPRTRGKSMTDSSTPAALIRIKRRLLENGWMKCDLFRIPMSSSAEHCPLFWTRLPDWVKLFWCPCSTFCWILTCWKVHAAYVLKYGVTSWRKFTVMLCYLLKGLFTEQIINPQFW